MEGFIVFILIHLYVYPVYVYLDITMATQMKAGYSMEVPDSMPSIEYRELDINKITNSNIPSSPSSAIPSTVCVCMHGSNIAAITVRKHLANCNTL